MNKKENPVIKIFGAKENNLKNIDIEIPKFKFVVMTGISGSGKSSLAFDTLYQEGRRRYVESLSAYARQFLGSFEKPKVDLIEGLSPAIAIEQKTRSSNPRSTVGTVTEIYDFFRLLYAKIGKPYDPITNEELKKYTIEEMKESIINFPKDSKLIILSPILDNDFASNNIIDNYIKEGFIRFWINEKIYEIEEIPKLNKDKKYSIKVVVDRLILNDDINKRLYESLELASKISNGTVEVLINNKLYIYSEHYISSGKKINIPKLEHSLFSFNTPIGACPYCKGIGHKMLISEDLILDREKPLLNGGLVAYKNAQVDSLIIQELETIAKFYKIDIDKPIKELTKKEINYFLYGTPDKISFSLLSSNGNLHESYKKFEGIIPLLEDRFINTTSDWIRDWISNFMVEKTCNKCGGARLNEQALTVKIGGLNIYELSKMSIDNIILFFKNLKLSKTEETISNLLLSEIKSRLQFLKDVGLGYINLSREANTLSGGEAQRIKLATQIGTNLSGVLYVLDEPSIGLHQRDNQRLIDTLKKMRDLDNTIVVVEHDYETMLQSDYLIDIGPGAGKDGGYVVAKGTPSEVMKVKDSITGMYLSNKFKIDIPSKRRPIDESRYIEIVGATENNLKNINCKIYTNVLTVVTGVSGSGKSTLINEILLKTLRNKYYEKKVIPGKAKKVNDNNLVEKIVEISQDPIGRTPRSNPATYTGVFDDIRNLYASTKEAKIRGYDKGRFSFNVKGGRCEICHGDGVKKISMHFLPDVYVKCRACGGTRYNKETLDIKYHGKNISEVLDMTVNEAIDFFKNQPKILKQLKVMQEVGLGYIKLGQQAPTLSGGEAQRVKLASELQKQITSKTLFILDEPTTGLHAYDCKKLINVFNKIVDKKATMVVIEHNLDIIKNADYIIDLGPEGGENGGKIIATGTPEEVSKNAKSYTGKYLKDILKS